MRAHDLVTMTRGPYKGHRGFISDEQVILPTVPAVIVWLWEIDVSIVTVRSHFRNHGSVKHHAPARRQQKREGAA